MSEEGVECASQSYNLINWTVCIDASLAHRRRLVIWVETFKRFMHFYTPFWYFEAFRFWKRIQRARCLATVLLPPFLLIILPYVRILFCTLFFFTDGNSLLDIVLAFCDKNFFGILDRHRKILYGYKDLLVD